MALQAKIDFDFGSAIGTIGFVSIKPLKGGEDQYGNTHIAIFTIQGLNKSGDPKKEKDSIFFSCGGIKGDTLTAKDSNGNWVDVVKGCDVRFQFTQNGDWCNVKRSQIVVTKVVADNPKQHSSSSAPQVGARKSENFGVKVGHLQNCVENYLGDAVVSDEEYLKTAEDFNQLTAEVANYVRNNNPEYSVFEVDSTAGRAVLSASRNANTLDLEVVRDYALRGVSDILRGGLLSIVKGEVVNNDTIKPKDNPPMTSPQEVSQEPYEDFNDDVPF